MNLHDCRRRPVAPPVVAAATALLLAASASAHSPDEEAEQIAELLALGPGSVVGDVGAGDGEWSERMATRVGPTGHVYVNEIDDGELISIREMIERSELGNMSAIEGTVDDANLPPACCDAILLRRVYHHMTEAAAMRASLRRALRSSGLVLVIEMDGDDGHGLPTDRLITEMTGDGFEVVSRHPTWGGHDGHYAVLFRR